jgi:hypothetical protein
MATASLWHIGAMVSSDSLVDELKAHFAKEGVLIGSRTRVTAITASATGDVIIALVLLVPKGFLGKIGEDLCDTTKSALKSVFARLREHYRGGIEFYDGEIKAVIEPDLPDEALGKLVDLPESPSGVVRYDRKLGRWVDVTDWSEETD